MLLSRRLPRFNRRLDDLGRLISNVDAIARRTVEHVFCAEKALMQIQVEWEHFVRDLILDSATGTFRNSSGPVVSQVFPKIRSREAAAHILVASYQNRRFEPDWYIPTEAINAAIRLDVSNAAQISAELGLTPWPIDELRHLRNFIAHKSKRSALSVRGTGLVPSTGEIDVIDIALEYGAGGIKRYEGWIAFAKGAGKRLAA